MYAFDGDNMKVKVFDEEHEDDLTQAINAFFKEHPNIKMKDIRFSTAACIYEETQIHCFSALLVYEE